MLEGGKCSGENRPGRGGDWYKVVKWKCALRSRRKSNVARVMGEGNRRRGREGRVGNFLEL